MIKLKRKNLFYSFATCFCLLLGGAVGINLNTFSRTEVFADETIYEADYFKAYNSETLYEYKSNNDTVFLNAGQKLIITFGKPVGNIAEGSEGKSYFIYDSMTEIGNSAIYAGFLNCNLKYDGFSGDPSNDVDCFETTYEYIPSYQTNKEIINNNLDLGNDIPENIAHTTLSYYTITIDLSKTELFKTGKYEILFTYKVGTGTDYSVTSEKTFKRTLFIFNTTDYFTSDNATTQNSVMSDTRVVTPVNSTYKNYYFYNYTNYEKTNDQSKSYLPTLQFDSNKFNVTLTKTYQGVSEEMTISAFNGDPYYSLGTATTKSFVKIQKNSNIFTLTFSDVGEYKISYEYIYKDGNQFVKLASKEITSAISKLDILYIFGYQLYYYDKNSYQNEEFKIISEQNTTANENSADVSYKLPYSSLTTTNVLNDNIDNEIMDKLKVADVLTLPASTNQPAISSAYNANLDKNNSYYYLWNKETGEWSTTTIPYQNLSLADSGIYLLKVVYTYDNNLDNNGNSEPSSYFCQFFFFEISTETATVTLKECKDLNEDELYSDDEKTVITTGYYTQNDVEVSVSGQSLFNSDTTLIIYSKNFGESDSKYTIEQILYGSNVEKASLFTQNKNYKVVLNYGKNKSITSYFTIDKTNFDGVKIYNVENSYISSNTYIKNTNYTVDFFSQKPVTVQWNEKLSGASSCAYYKFIPFKEVAKTTENYYQFTNNNAIPTNYALDYEITDKLPTAVCYNSNSESILSSKYVFSEQGLYIIKVADEAGNWQYITFCIDKTNICIWQCSYATYDYQTTHNYNVVASDTIVQWGKYKLITTNITKNNIKDIQDEWVKDFFKTKSTNPMDNDLFENEYNNDKLCLAPEISGVSYIQEGNSYIKHTPSTAIYSLDIILNTTLSSYTFAKELTYSIYLIDESNVEFFKDANALSVSEFVQNCDLSYTITASSDSSEVDFFINNSNKTENNLSTISYDSYSLEKVGFTDSSSNLNETYIDIRSLYYASTGTTISGDVSLLTLKIKLDPSDIIKTESLVMYYYPFDTNTYEIQETPIKTILYDKNNKSSSVLSSLSNDFNGYWGYNINPKANTSKNIYETLEGKYVFVRTYTNDSAVEDNDFLIREYAFIIERQKIVSSPTYVEDAYISVVGQNIHINVLDGNIKQLSFNDMYKAYSASESILVSNKLPLVLYVPINKFGTASDNGFVYENSGTEKQNFTPNQTLEYYYDVIKDNNIYKIKLHSQDGLTQAKLCYSYFGNNQIVSDNFTSGQNYAKIKNSSFDLSVIVEYSQTKNGVRTTIETDENKNGFNGFFVSDKLSQPGYYYVTITQNAVGGSKDYPNSYAKFSFSYQIISKAPTFEITTQDGDELNSDEEQLSNGIIIPSEDELTYYTNEKIININWKESTDDYFAKINISDNGSGKTKGIYYYTNKSSVKQYIPINTITISSDKKSYSFPLDISQFDDGTILYIYMEYEIGNEYQIENVTNLTKKVYIDRQAPTKVLSQILGLNTTVDSSVQLNDIIKYITNSSDSSLVNAKSYYIPTQTGILANYKFILNIEGNTSPILTTQNAINGYYTEGYYYYCKLLGSQSVSESDIETAKDAYANFDALNNVTTFLTGKTDTYEIVEKDLAGNIAIYLVRFVNNSLNKDAVVLSYEKPIIDDSISKTIAPEGPLTYQQLENQTKIFAKNNLDILSINLFNNEWLSIVVDGKEYMHTPALNINEFYSFDNWIDHKKTPSIVLLSDILSFDSSRTKHNLTIINPTTEENFSIDLYISNEVLNVTSNVSLNNKDVEGITIKGIQYTDGIYVIPHTVIIKQHIKNNYEKIYEASVNFTSNTNITFTKQNNNWYFAINDYVDTDSFEYIVYDNFGQRYIISHTVNEPIIEDDVIGEVDVITIDDGEEINDWYVSDENLTFLYSSVDYRVFLQFDYLVYDEDNISIAHYPATPSTDIARNFGVEVTSDTFSDKSVFFSVDNKIINTTIGKLTLKAQPAIPGLENYSGNILKYTITLVNSHKSGDEAFNKEFITQKHFLINNLTSNISLYNKNGHILDNSKNYSTFFGQVTIKFDKIQNLDIPFVSDYVFETIQTMIYEDEEEVEINSGTIVNEPGQYTIITYLKINNTLYKCFENVFAISQSNEDFYSISILNQETGKIEYVSPTEDGYTDSKGNFYACHYIVNTKDYKITKNEEQFIECTKNEELSTSTTTIYTITNKDAVGTETSSINYFTKVIAVSVISSSSLISQTNFNYIDVNGSAIQLTGTSAQVIVTDENQEFSSLQIFFDSFYGIKENKIIPIIVSDYEIDINNVYKQINNNISCITLTNSGYYSIAFQDLAGNTHNFSDTVYNYKDKYFQLLFVNGVAYNINGKAPIQNAIYNDEVEISLPSTLDNIYDAGGKPKISVLKNGLEYSVSKNERGNYALNEPGYYTVCYEAKIKGKDVRKQTYSFIILNKNEYRVAFEYSQYNNYEIVEILKNGIKQDYSQYFDNKSLQISAYDLITGVGEYEVTIATNSEIKDEKFTFKFVINTLETVPISVSVKEGTSTSGKILVSFNAYNIFERYGEVKILIGNKSININENYLQSLNENYFVSEECSRIGENFIQVQTSSGKVIYSYKVTKVEPLNTLSIVFIVIAVGVVGVITVTFIMLRRKMKIK